VTAARSFRCTCFARRRGLPSGHSRRSMESKSTSHIPRTMRERQIDWSAPGAPGMSNRFRICRRFA
jgi:hypothetical protein